MAYGFATSDNSLLAVVLMVVVTTGYVFGKRKRARCPPGPIGLPVLGYAPFLGKNPGLTIMRLKKKYGPVIRLKLGTETWVVLNDFKTVNEGSYYRLSAFCGKSDIFSNRPVNPIMAFLSENGYGTFYARYGPTWKKLRKLGQQKVHGFGGGHQRTECCIMEEFPHLLNNLTSRTSDSLRTKMTLAVGNTMSKLMFGTRFSYDDQNYRNLLLVVTRFMSDNMTAKLMGITGFIHSLRHFPIIEGAFRSCQKELDDMYEILRKIFDKHQENFDENDIRDYVDSFIKKIKENEENGVFNEIQMKHCVREIFQAGIGTTTSTMLWIILGLATFPQAQEKIAKEIEDILGADGMATVKHSAQMPYTNSFIHEVTRHRTLVPLGVFHNCKKTTEVGGYSIPKGATVASNLWAILHDPDVFENPDEFRPERFVDTEGKFVASPQVISFGIGPRRCMGERLAKEELFLFTTSILQKLRIVQDPACPLPDFNEAGQDMFTYEPPEFEVAFETR